MPVTSHHRIRANSSSGHVEAGAMGLLDLTQVGVVRGVVIIIALSLSVCIRNSPLPVVACCRPYGSMRAYSHHLLLQGMLQ